MIFHSYVNSSVVTRVPFTRSEDRRCCSGHSEDCASIRPSNSGTNSPNGMEVRLTWFRRRGLRGYYPSTRWNVNIATSKMAVEIVHEFPHWKWWIFPCSYGTFIVDLPVENVDFQCFFVCFSEGTRFYDVPSDVLYDLKWAKKKTLWDFVWWIRKTRQVFQTGESIRDFQIQRSDWWLMLIIPSGKLT